MPTRRGLVDIGCPYSFLATIPVVWVLRMLRFPARVVCPELDRLAVHAEPECGTPHQGDAMIRVESAKATPSPNDFSPERLCDLNEVQAAAEDRLDPATLQLVNGGAGSGAAVRANADAWQRWALRSRVLRDISTISLSTTVLGIDVACPILLAPSGQHQLAHPDGEVATARAARNADTIMVLSMGTSRTLEDVAAERSKLWLQLYWSRDRGQVRDFVAQAVAAGIRALCLTVDMPVRPSLSRAMQKAVAVVRPVPPSYLAPRARHP